MEDQNNLHESLLLEFDDIVTSSREDREQCLEDRRFYSIAGAMWEGELGRQFENKPKLEVNKIHLAVMRIFSEYRNNRISVNFLPKDGNDKLADVCDQLYRADEQDSAADEAYDNAFEEAVGGGIGAWRLCSEYEDEDDDENEYQRIKIEPIYDADSSVFFDLNAKRQDKSDAKTCFVLTSMPIKSFQAEYGTEASSMRKDIANTQFDWTTPDVAYVAEVYKVEKVPHIVKYYKLVGMEGVEEQYTADEIEEDPEIEASLYAEGYVLDREKKTKKQKIHKYIISGNKILEDCGYIAGSEIPIVPVYGKRWFIDNQERTMGHVRLAKDAQRLKNMQLSKLAELAAISPNQKPILTTEQIAGHEKTWADDNIKNYPYLPINAMTDANGNPVNASPVGMVQPPQIPPAMAALLQLTETDIIDVLGNQQQGEQIMSNISGDAIEKIQDRLDMQTYIYVSNLAKAMQRSGKIWLSMARELYIEEDREKKGMTEEGEAKMIKLNTLGKNDDGTIGYVADMTKAKFDVFADVGATTSTKRKATVKALREMMTATADQETINILGSLAIINMEGEGVTDVRKYFRSKLIKMNVLEPTEDELQEMMQELQNAQPDANTLYLQSEAQKNQAITAKTVVDTELSKAKANETLAKAMKIMADMDTSKRQEVLGLLDRISQQEQGTQSEQQSQPMTQQGM